MLRSPTAVVDVMNPNVAGSEILFPGFDRFGLLSTLSISRRNCTAAEPGSLNVRNTPRSRFQNPGPRSVFRGDVPKRCGWPAAMLTTWYALRSKYWYAFGSAPAGGRFT